MNISRDLNTSAGLNLFPHKEISVLFCQYIFIPKTIPYSKIANKIGACIPINLKAENKSSKFYPLDKLKPKTELKTKIFFVGVNWNSTTFLYTLNRRDENFFLEREKSFLVLLKCITKSKCKQQQNLIFFVFGYSLFNE